MVDQIGLDLNLINSKLSIQLDLQHSHIDSLLGSKTALQDNQSLIRTKNKTLTILNTTIQTLTYNATMQSNFYGFT